MLLIQRQGVLFTSSPVAPVVVNSVNGGADVWNNQNIVNIVGSGFGEQQGTAVYNSIPLVVLTWADTLVQVAWPDVPFNPAYSDIDMNSTLTLTVERQDATSSGSQNVTTIPNPNAYYGIITSAPVGSLYADDTGIEFNVDKGYIRILGGRVDSVDVATGIVSGISGGASVEYAVFDVSLTEWAN